MSKRPFDETIKLRILCIAHGQGDTYIRRVFSTEEKALQAEKKLTNNHGWLISTWVRSPTQQETIDMFHSMSDWCKIIDDDSLLIEVVDIKIRYFHNSYPEKVGLHNVGFVVLWNDSIRSCQALESALNKKYVPTKSSKTFVIRHEKRLATNEESIDTFEQVMEKFNKS